MIAEVRYSRYLILWVAIGMIMSSFLPTSNSVATINTITQSRSNGYINLTVTWSKEYNVSQMPAYDSSCCKIAVDSKNNVHIVWDEVTYENNNDDPPV